MDKILAVEILEETLEARLWRRENETVTSFSVDFKPWLISSFKSSNQGARVTKLQGDNAIRWMHEYNSAEAYNTHRHSFPYGKSLIWDDWRQQVLAVNPAYYLFQKMRFEDLQRFTFDIETTSVKPDKGRILMISVKFGDTEVQIIDDDEAGMINQLNYLIQIVDPDVIEGFNIYKFDIPFLMARAAVHGIELNWGRGQEPLTIGRKWKFRVGSYDRPVQSYGVFGRHFVDGMLVAMRYDSNTGGNFDAFGLKYLAEQMGVKSENRVVIAGPDIPEMWEKNRELVILYSKQDVQETRDLIELMVQPEFYLTNIIPDTFQNILLSGGATKINLMLVSQYVREGHAVPVPPGEREEYEGGAVELRQAGVFHSVAKADVASLYPAIMLYAPAEPATDELRLFHRTLKTLTEKRLEIKAAEKQSQDEDEKRYLKGIQESFKILINSFYGYLATGLHFSDFAAAAKVTTIGRGIVTDMADQIEAMGLLPIELDTDGVYFQYSADFPIGKLPEFLNLPDHIEVEIEPYAAMVSVAAKNYVLKKLDGILKFHGNSLRSRRDEGFGRKFVNDVVARLLDGHPEDIPVLYAVAQKKFLGRGFEPLDLAKRERISDKTATSPGKARLKAAVGQTDLEEGDYIRVYSREDGTLAPIEVYAKDEDRLYYLERLWKFGQRLDSLFQVYNIELPKVYKAQWYEMSGIEKPKRIRKIKENG